MVHDPLIMTATEICCQHKLLSTQLVVQPVQANQQQEVSYGQLYSNETGKKTHSFSTELPNFKHLRVFLQF